MPSMQKNGGWCQSSHFNWSVHVRELPENSAILRLPKARYSVNTKQTISFLKVVEAVAAAAATRAQRWELALDIDSVQGVLKRSERQLKVSYESTRSSASYTDVRLCGLLRWSASSRVGKNKQNFVFVLLRMVQKNNITSYYCFYNLTTHLKPILFLFFFTHHFLKDFLFWSFYCWSLSLLVPIHQVGWGASRVLLCLLQKFRTRSKSQTCAFWATETKGRFINQDDKCSGTK